MSKAIYALIVIIVLAAGGYFIFNQSQTPAANTGNTATTTTPATTTTGGTTATATTTQIKLALLDTTGSGTGKPRGCDTITLVTRTIPATTTPLTAAMQALFAEKEGTQPSSQYNFIARTKSTLKFDHASVQSGTASIYLTGSLSGLAGVCDDPRAQAQIEETALQFPTVKNVQIYLNNILTPLTPSERG